MTKDYNSSNTPNNNRRRNTPSEGGNNPRYSGNRDNNRGGSRPPHQRNNNYRRSNDSKSMIILKSSVYALGIVLIVLVAAFLFIKNSKYADKMPFAPKCENVKSVKISDKVEKIIVDRREIFVLTKDSNHKQELIKLDRKCLSEISRNSFVN